MKHRIYFNQKNRENYSLIWLLLLCILSPLGILGQTDCVYDDGCPSRLTKIGACDVQPGGYTGYELTGIEEVIMQREGGSTDCGIHSNFNYLFEDCDGNVRVEIGKSSNGVIINGDPGPCDFTDDCSSNSSHSYKVAIRMIGNYDDDQRGVSPFAESHLFDNSDFAEEVTCDNDYYISCNTYHGGTCSGFYNSWTSNRDNFLFGTVPEHLYIKSSSNYSSSYGCIPPNYPDYQLPNGTPSCKNTLIVGSTSSQTLNGPTSDGRIKPDVVANGIIDSSTGSGDFQLFSSWSAPMVAGEAALIREQWTKFPPPISDEQVIYSSILKNIILHSSIPCSMDTDLETWEQTYTGPDYDCGWGYVNAHKAVELVKQNHDNGGNTIHYNSIIDGVIDTYTITTSNDAQDLKATIVWTDPGGNVPVENTTTGIVTPNNPTATALVNNLNIRILDSNGNVFEPFLLDPANPTAAAAKGIDNINNVEQVYISPNELLPNETYTIEVSHSGSLQNGLQAYSLIFTEGANYYLGCSNPMGVVEDTVYYCPTATSVQLEAFGGNIYQWEPATGLSDPTIANPTLDVSVLNGETGYYVVKAIDTDGCWHNTKIVLEPDSCTEDCLAPEDVQIMIELDSWDWIDVSRDAIVTTSIPESYNPVYDWTVTDEATPPNSVTVTDHGRIFNVSNFDNGYLFEFCVTVSYQGGSCEYSYCITMDLAPATGGYSCIADNPLDQVISYNLTGSTVTVNPINSSYYIDNMVTWNLFADDGTIIDTQTQSDENQSISFSLPFDGAYHLRLDVMSIYDSNCDVSIYEYFTSGNTCPDLTVDYPSIGLGYLPTLGGVFIEPGKPTILSAVVNNIGTESTQGGESLGMYLSGDDFVDANDVYLGGVSIPVLGANQRIKLGSRVTIPKKFSRHIDRILFAADYLDISKECLETNNTASVLINTGLKKTDLAAGNYTNIVNLSPNPAKDFFTIDYLLEDEVEVSFELYTILGKLEKTIQYNDLQVSGQYSLNVDITDLSSGLYLLHTQIGDRQIIQKIMKSE